MLRTHATAKQLCDWVKRADATQREERRRQRNRQRALANAHGNWARVMEIVKEQEKDDADLDEEPALLQKRNFPDLLKWVTRRLFVEKKIDMRGHEQSTLMLQYQVENRRRHVMAHRMQGMWRSFKARTKVSALRPWSACAACLLCACLCSRGDTVHFLACLSPFRLCPCPARYRFYRS